jgi:hypothetical protein
MAIWRNTNELTTRPLFEELFPTDPEVLAAVKASMKADGWHGSSVIVSWRDKATGELVVVDGHTRLLAAKAAGLEKVYVETPKLLIDEEAAFDYAVREQRDRRNLTKLEIAEAIAEAELRRADSKDLAMPARSLGPPKGQKGGGGSTKDPVKQAVVEKAATQDISERTARQGLANRRAARSAPKAATVPKPVTIAELKELQADALTAARAVGPALTTLAKTMSYDDAMVAFRAAGVTHHIYTELLKKLDKYIDQQENTK